MKPIVGSIVALITPIIVPVILVGIAVFYAYVQLKLVNSLIGVVLAHSMLAIPLVMMIAPTRPLSTSRGSSAWE